MDKEFLIEQYKQNWEYIRQCEDVRLKHTQIFFVVTATFLSFFAFLIKGEIPEKTLLEVISPLKSLVIAVLAFLSIYSSMITAFILFQKRGYEAYRTQNFEIEAHFKNTIFNPDNRPIWKEFALKSAFTWWFGSVALICALLWTSLVVVLACI